MNKRGCVTLATGGERYYKMALNLRNSIKLANPNMNIGIVTDKGNPYINLFDDVVFINNPRNSYVDKIDMLINCPYDINLFIEADCLVYNSLDYLFDIFKDCGDFSAFGEEHPLDSIGKGWFDKCGAGKYQQVINYIPSFHGGIYYIKPGEFCNKMHSLCLEILNNYYSFKFNGFPNPADETIIALACSVLNAKLTPWIQPSICTIPSLMRSGKKILRRLPNRFRGESLTIKSKTGEIEKQSILHFGSYFTTLALYQAESKKLNSLLNGKTTFYWLDWSFYFIKDMIAKLTQKLFKK